MQRPIHTRLGAIAGGTQKSGKSHRHFAEQRRDPVRPPVLHVASPAAGTAIRTKPPMLIGLTRSDRSLNARQKQLRLGKAQAQVRDLPKAFRPADLNQVSAPRDGIIACLDQPHHPPHRSSSSRSLNRLVVPILSASPYTPISGQSPISPTADAHLNGTDVRAALGARSSGVKSFVNSSSATVIPFTPAFPVRISPARN